MKHRFLLSVLAAADVLAGCAAPAPAPAPQAAAAAAPAPAAPCNAEAARFAVGQPHTAQLETTARHRSGARTSRAIKPGQAVTMEFDGSRLNLDVDARNHVTGVRCG